MTQTIRNARRERAYTGSELTGTDEDARKDTNMTNQESYLIEIAANLSEEIYEWFNDIPLGTRLQMEARELIYGIDDLNKKIAYLIEERKANEEDE